MVSARSLFFIILSGEIVVTLNERKIVACPEQELRPFEQAQHYL
jgi:hypothetical protein